MGVDVTSTTPAEVTLVEPTLTTIRAPRVHGGAPRHKPRRIVADRAYDGDPLRGRSAQRGITSIAPYRENRQHRPFEDGRQLRRYFHRWIVERTFARLGGSRRLVIRHVRITSMYCASLHFAAALIALRRF